MVQLFPCDFGRGGWIRGAEERVHGPGGCGEEGFEVLWGLGFGG